MKGDLLGQQDGEGKFSNVLRNLSELIPSFHYLHGDRSPTIFTMGAESHLDPEQ